MSYFVITGAEPGADLGPLISPEAKQRVHDLVQSGLDEGAKVSTVYIGYSVTASSDVSVIVIESRAKHFACHTNCISYSDLACSNKSDIMIERCEAKPTILYKVDRF